MEKAVYKHIVKVLLAHLNVVMKMHQLAMPHNVGTVNKIFLVWLLLSKCQISQQTLCHIFGEFCNKVT